MKKIEKITIILPQKGEGELVELTRQICLKTGQDSGGGLGGKYGYGIDFENDIFMIHHYCWCEEDSCKWCNGHEPNFLFKPTGYKVWWYKWIGRSQEEEGNKPQDMYERCYKSIWEKGDCWYELHIEPFNLREGFGGTQPSVEFCFNVFNKNSLVKAKLSEFADNNAYGWSFDTILSDMCNARFEETKGYKKALRLDKKYPRLREYIKQRAIKYHKDMILWHKQAISKLI